MNPKAFGAIKESLLLVEKYRNNIVHYYNEELEPYIFMLAAKAALNYVEFVKEYFNKDILVEDGLFILPLGFKLPFKPEDFLCKKAAEYVSSEEAKAFINSMVKVVEDLDSRGIEDTIVVGFDIYLENVKKIKNSDLIVAITTVDEADAKFSKVNKFKITNEKGAQPVTLSDEEIIKLYPLTYQDVCDACKNCIPGFKRNKDFNEIISQVKKNINCAYTRKLNPQRKKTTQTVLYSEAAIKEIKRRYDEKK